jgi:hypothetical protein
MTLEEWNDRRLDDLAGQVRVVAALATQVATNSANITGHDDDIARLGRMLEGVSKACEDHVDRIEKKLDEQAKSSQANRTAWITAAIGPGLVALIGIAAALILGGPK